MAIIRSTSKILMELSADPVAANRPEGEGEEGRRREVEGEGGGEREGEGEKEGEEEGGRGEGRDGEGEGMEASKGRLWRNRRALPSLLKVLTRDGPL